MLKFPVSLLTRTNVGKFADKIVSSYEIMRRMRVGETVSAREMGVKKLDEG